jgi:hypothetical protein
MDVSGQFEHDLGYGRAGWQGEEAPLRHALQHPASYCGWSAACGVEEGARLVYMHVYTHLFSYSSKSPCQPGLKRGLVGCSCHVVAARLWIQVGGAARTWAPGGCSLRALGLEGCCQTALSEYRETVMPSVVCLRRADCVVVQTCGAQGCCKEGGGEGASFGVTFDLSELPGSVWLAPLFYYLVLVLMYKVMLFASMGFGLWCMVLRDYILLATHTNHASGNHLEGFVDVERVATVENLYT